MQCTEEESDPTNQTQTATVSDSMKGKEWNGEKGVQKRDSPERETERESMLVQEKQRQCTQETQDKHTSLTEVCNQAERFKCTDLQDLQSNVSSTTIPWSRVQVKQAHRNKGMPDLSRDMRKNSCQSIRDKIFNSQNKPNYIRKNCI